MLGRETPSVAGIINPGSQGFQKIFFGQKEILIPVHATYVFLIYTNCITFCSFPFGLFYLFSYYYAALKQLVLLILLLMSSSTLLHTQGQEIIYYYYFKNKLKKRGNLFRKIIDLKFTNFE